MNDRMLDRLYSAISGLDVGVPVAMIRRDLLRASNLAAVLVGGPRIKSLEDDPSVRRLVVFLESASDG